MTQAKPGKREVITIAKFREETGVMNPGVWCKGHDLEGRAIYDMHDVDPEQNEVGRTLPLWPKGNGAQHQTALQIYTTFYKALPPDESFALLRKATKLDLYLPPQRIRSTRERACADCGVDVSPKWHDMDPTPGVGDGDGDGDVNMDAGLDKDENDTKEKGGGRREMLCHQCWFRH